MPDQAINTVTFGPGDKGRFTVKSFLEAAGLYEECKEFVGRGLHVAGLNTHVEDHVLRFQPGTESVDVLIPRLEDGLKTVPLNFDEVEVDRPAKTPEYQAEQLAGQEAQQDADEGAGEVEAQAEPVPEGQ